jgi:NAD(P)-dependent dehydrogenase (short-subunit alcohol dehydrogenase family)
MPGRLEGKVALVTGSSSGLGRAIAHAYAAEGAHVYCVDMYPGLRNAINANTGKADDFHNRVQDGIPTHHSLMEMYGGTHFYKRADMTNASDVESAVSACVDSFGRLDIMVNNAGTSVESTHIRPMRIHETEEEDYDKTMAINSKGIFLGCKYAIRQMLAQEPLDNAGADRGWIVNTASVQGLVAYWGTRTF